MIFTDKAAKEKISTLESRISELEADIITKDEAIDTLTTESTAKDQTIAEHIASIGTLTDAVSALTTEKETITAELVTAQVTITEKDAAIEAAKASAGQIATETLAAIGQPEPLGETGVTEAMVKTREEFNLLPPHAASKFCLSGGKIIG